MRALRVGLIGDRDDSITAHRANPIALRLAGEQLGRVVEADWLATDAMPDDADLARFDALWCVPGSPYRDMDAALRAIRFAREQGVPFLGTCGGFQHAVIDYARHVLGWADADHAETAPDAPRNVIALLECALVEATETLTLVPDSRLALACGTPTIQEGYRCRYGLNPAFVDTLTRGPLRVAATGPQGDVRAVELDAHPFFVCTLFQPERAALQGRTPPLVAALLRAAAH
ncbi:MAG: CTP synthase [Burkholderiales bacterium]